MDNLETEITIIRKDVSDAQIRDFIYQYLCLRFKARTIRFEPTAFPTAQKIVVGCAERRQCVYRIQRNTKTYVLTGPLQRNR